MTETGKCCYGLRPFGVYCVLRKLFGLGQPQRLVRPDNLLAEQQYTSEIIANGGLNVLINACGGSFRTPS